MNINDIAKLAGVSPATVSKVMHKKDSNLKQETRDKVLKIVKEYNYEPYSKSKGSYKSKTLLLGVLIRDMTSFSLFMRGVLESAQNHGYGTIIFENHCFEDELKNVSLLKKHNVEGVILACDLQDKKSKEELKKLRIPVFSFASDAYEYGKKINIDYHELGFQATEYVVKKMHKNIICVVDDKYEKTSDFVEGFKQCLFKNNISFNKRQIIKYSAIDKLLNRLFNYSQADSDQVVLSNSYLQALYHSTAVVCNSHEVAYAVAHWLRSSHLMIPKDYSIIGLSEGGEQCEAYKQLSLIKVPYYEYGLHIAESIINEIENQTVQATFRTSHELSSLASLDEPKNVKKKSIVVIGSIHMDVFMSVSELPQAGRTIKADKQQFIPGGKGVNQALVAAALGANVYLIAKCGRDYEGTMIYNELYRRKINMNGVVVEENLSTGKGFIYVAADGESSIAIFSGANNTLKIGDLIHNFELIKQASYCLLQTEIPLDVANKAAEIAAENGIKVILKPSTIDYIQDELLNNIYIFIPNEKELQTLCPSFDSIEDKAHYFLKKGVKHVIVTLGRKGCYYATDNYCKHYKAASYKAVDTTGAADVFIATLAVFLNESFDIQEAIKYAIVASGHSVTKYGVLPSLIDYPSLIDITRKNGNSHKLALKEEVKTS